MKRIAFTLALLIATAAAGQEASRFLDSNHCTGTLSRTDSTIPGQWGTQHGTFHSEFPITQESARYGFSQRNAGSVSGGEWCIASTGAVVGDNSTIGQWSLLAGMPAGTPLTSTDEADLMYRECFGTTACAWMRAKAGGVKPPVTPDHCNEPGAACRQACPPPPPPPRNCVRLAAVPLDVSATLEAAPDWVAPGGKRVKLKAARSTFHGVTLYSPALLSSGSSALKLYCEQP